MSQMFQFYSPPSINPIHLKSAAPAAGVVVSIQCLSSTSAADEWAGDLPQTGDIVEELAVESDSAIKSPFRRGSAGVQEILSKAYKNNKIYVSVRIRRGTGEYSELMACIATDEAGKRKKKEKQYVLRDLCRHDYIFGFCDRTEKECLQLQESRKTRMVNEANSWVMKDGFAPYDWDRKMHETLSIQNSSCFFSILFLPNASDHDLEEALARANTWLNASQNCGVPILFMNIQTESLLSKMSEETVFSPSRASGFSYSAMESPSHYEYDDYHVMRAVRLWYAPAAGEFTIEVKIRDGSNKLGFSLSRTDEGFIYISSVDELADKNASGLTYLFKQAKRSYQLIVISRISNQKILPRLVSADGEIRCYDVVSVSRKLLLHRHAKLPIVLHAFSLDETTLFKAPTVKDPSFKFDLETLFGSREADTEVVSKDMDEEVGTFSLRFRDIAIDEFSASSSDHIDS